MTKNPIPKMVKEWKDDLQKMCDDPNTGFDKVSIQVGDGPEIPIAEKRKKPAPPPASDGPTKFLKPLHLACVVDETRPNFKLIEIKNRIAQASNGHMIVKLELDATSELSPEDIEILDGKYIHMEVWKEIHKCNHLEFTEDEIICWKNGIKKVFEYGEPVGEFYKVENVIIEVRNNGTEAKEMISFQTGLIEKISDIFESSHLVYSFSKGNLGTVVFPTFGSGMFAILMPRDCKNESRYTFLT